MTAAALASEWLPEVSAGPCPQSSAATGSGLPEIRISDRELRDLSAETLEAIHAAKKPARLFARAGSVVRIDRDESGRPLVVRVSDVHLRGEMTRAANYFKLSKQNGEYVRTAVSPPVDAARDILPRPIAEIGFPLLDGVAEAPFIRSDGLIVSMQGYDPTTRIFYSPSDDLTDFVVPDRPTADDVDGARALIEEALGEFPFEDAASRANAFALFITPEVQQAINGSIPMALIDAPQAESGKTLLVSIISEKTTGTAAAMKPAPIRDDDEWRKTLTATTASSTSSTSALRSSHCMRLPTLRRRLPPRARRGDWGAPRLIL